MKPKLLLSSLLFLSVTFCCAQKLTPQLLQGQWRAVALNIPDKLFYNSLTDSIVIRDEKQLEELTKMTNTGLAGKLAYDSIRNELKKWLQSNVVTFDKKGNLIAKPDHSKALYYFSKRKARFSAANGPNIFVREYLEGSMQNGFLMLIFSNQSTDQTLWLKKIE